MNSGILMLSLQSHQTSCIMLVRNITIIRTRRLVDQHTYGYMDIMTTESKKDVEAEMGGTTLYNKTCIYLRFRNLPGGEPLEERVLSLEGRLLLDSSNSSRELHCCPQLHPPLVALCPATTNPSIQNQIRLTKPVIHVKKQVAYIVHHLLH